MTQEYSVENVTTHKVKNISSALDSLRERFKKTPTSTPIKKQRGGLNQVTELRAETAKLLKISMGQIYGLTKNWSVDELYRTLKSAKDFKENPPALWWKLYKQNKNNYGRINQKALLRNGKERREEERRERQGALF